jgi:hypothetical protein
MDDILRTPLATMPGTSLSTALSGCARRVRWSCTGSTLPSGVSMCSRCRGPRPTLRSTTHCSRLRGCFAVDCLAFSGVHYIAFLRYLCHFYLWHFLGFGSWQSVHYIAFLGYLCHFYLWHFLGFGSAGDRFVDIARIFFFFFFALNVDWALLIRP